MQMELSGLVPVQPPPIPPCAQYAPDGSSAAGAEVAWRESAAKERKAAKAARRAKKAAAGGSGSSSDDPTSVSLATTAIAPLSPLLGRVTC